jgi:hypothetical protein
MTPGHRRPTVKSNAGEAEMPTALADCSARAVVHIRQTPARGPAISSYRTDVIALRFCAQASGVEAGSIGRDLP